jgi:ABC-type Mn2+/Zn2+ transport system ATPase subunit
VTRAAGGPARTVPSALVEVRGASFGYDGAPVLSDVSLTVLQGAFTGIVGPSGSGKTSLLRCCSAPRAAARLGRAAGPASPCRTSRSSRRSTGTSRHGRRVRPDVRPTRRLLPWATPRRRPRSPGSSSGLGIGELAHRHIRELSGGQQQRMFLAAALLRRPSLLLLDEPTSGVDVGTRHEVLHLLDDLNRDGLAIVLTTHDLNGMAAHLPHLVALQRPGRSRPGPPQEVIVPEVLERTFGRAHGGPAAPRHAGRRRRRRPRRPALGGG